MGSWSTEHLQTIGLAPELDDARDDATTHHDDATPTPGEHIDRYVVLRTLGRGGMGVVCLAHDPKLDRNVALKLHRDDREPRADAHARLRREARQLARLTHPNVVPVFDVGVARGRTFVAMQYVEGATLAAWLRERPRGRAEILRVFLEAARGLAAAHALGIIHRDFKPDNVLVGDDGHARVVDFGLARALDPAAASERGRDHDAGTQSRSAAVDATPLHGHAIDSEALTHVGIVLGTPAYMAPEQHRGLPLTPAADQYAFCVALYEALAGRRPFEADSPGALLRLKQRERLAAPLGQRLPSWLLAVLQRGLRADPHARHRDMDAVVTACQRHRGRRRWQAIVAATGTVAAIAWAWPRPPPRCDADERIAARWSADDAAILTRAFEATGVVHAGTTAARTTAALDRRAQQWRAAGFALCHAALEPAVLEARTRCLDDRLATFEELVEVFRHADAEVVDRAVLAIDGLPEVDDCTSLAPTTDATSSSAADREANAAVHRELLRAQTLENAGRYTAELEVAAAARRDAAALGDASLQAHAEYAYGSALEQVSDLDGAREHLHAALTEANALGDDALAAEAAMELVWLDGLDAADLDAARTWQRFAEDALHRRPDLAREARLANALGAMYSAAGAAQQASEQFQRALDAFERLADAGATEGPWPDAEGSPDVATAAMNLGIMQAELGRLDTARALLERAHRMYRAIEGPDHPDISNVLDAMGGVALRMGDLVTARREFTEAFALRTRSYPAGHVVLARSHNSLGSLLEAEGDDEAAAAAYGRAVEGLAANLGEHALVGAALVNVGSAQCRAGRFDAAIASDVRGLVLLRAGLPDDHAWITLGELGLARAELGRGDLDAAARHHEAVAPRCEAPAADQVACAMADAIAAAIAHRRARPGAAQLVARARAGLDALGPAGARDREEFERWLTVAPASPWRTAVVADATVVLHTAAMSELLHLDPDDFARELARHGGRALLYWDHDHDRMVADAAWLEPLAAWCNADTRDMLRHEAIAFGVGPETGALFGAFVHHTVRGQAAGGLRFWPYATLESFVRDGLRLSLGMSRKNALAGLWWGGGKGIVLRRADAPFRDRDYRRTLYREYGRFTTSLRGVYITAEDVGTGPDDMAAVFETTRFVTCVPPAVGGSGNPSHATARGVVCAMEAALDHLGRGDLVGKTVAMQGAGNVAGFMIDELLARGIGRVIASDISPARVDELRQHYAGRPVELRLAAPDDRSIFAEPCDIFAPNALGGVLEPETIAMLRCAVVCGAANNQLLDDRRDDRLLAERGIVYVPDFVANRMGIVNCANEQYGQLDHDPAFERHLGRGWDQSVWAVTRRMLQRAATEGITTARAANALADEACGQPHPIWGHRGRAIIDALRAR